MNVSTCCVKAWARLDGVPVTREGFKTAARRVLALAVCDGGLWGLAA